MKNQSSRSVWKNLDRGGLIKNEPSRHRNEWMKKPRPSGWKKWTKRAQDQANGEKKTNEADVEIGGTIKTEPHTDQAEGPENRWTKNTPF